MTTTGKVIVRIDRSSVRRMKEKLKSLNSDEVAMSYASWKGFAKGYNTYKLLCKLDKMCERRGSDVTTGTNDTGSEYRECENDKHSQ